jgi:transposase
MADALEKLSKKELVTEIISLKTQNARLEERLSWLEKQVFGKKSEKVKQLDPEEQTTLGFEEVQTSTQLPTETITVTYQKEKKKKNEGHPGRNELPDHLETEVTEIHPEGDLEGKVCIGKQERKVLERIPGRFIIKHYILYIYKDKEGKISEGKMPTLPIEKGIPGPGLLAFILVNKFMYHLPLHRQLEIFKNEAQMIIKGSTISGWVGQCCRLLLLLYDRLLERILSQSYLMVDETPIKVLMKEGEKKIILGYFWVYYSPELKAVFFDFRKGRGAENPASRLKNFKGHIQTDGYIAYKVLPGQDIKFLNCMAHARRKFIDARENYKKYADEFINLAAKLYRVEKRAKAWQLTNEDRFIFRQKRSQPILNKMKIWLDQKKNENLPSKFKITEAINYTLAHWSGLIKYLDDGKLEIDNNPVERSIRPVALGRKNFMFAGSEEGAKSMAMMYSFYGTCRAQGKEPYEWTKIALEKMPDYDPKLIEELLPFIN